MMPRVRVFAVLSGLMAHGDPGKAPRRRTFARPLVYSLRERARTSLSMPSRA